MATYPRPETDPVAEASLATHVATQPAHGGDLAGTPRPPTSHVHIINEVTGLQVALDEKANDVDLSALVEVVGGKADASELISLQPLSAKNQPSGYAGLDSGGKLIASQLPALAIGSTFTVASQAAQLALTTQEGDVAVRTDESKTYIQNGGTSGTMSDWTLIATPVDTVLSVAGKTGAVSLATDDVSGLDTALEGKASTATTTALSSRVSVIDKGSDWTAGDNITLNLGSVGNVGIKGEIRHGSVASPFTTQGSTFKISQVSAITQAEHDTWAGYGVGGQTQDTGTLALSALGAPGSEMQVSALTLFARNMGTSGKPDATPLFSYSWQRDEGAIGRAISGYAAARNDLPGGKLTGFEIQAQNHTGSYIEANNVGVTDAVGLLVSAGSSAYQGGGAGIQFHHPVGWAKLDVGILVSSQDGGPIKGALIRDNSEGEYSLDIRGKHAKAAIKIAKESGSLIIGADELTTTTTQLFELHAGGVTRDPIFKITAGGKVNTAILFNNTISQFHFGQAGVTDGLLKGTVGGDAALELPEANSFHVGRVGARATLRVGTNVRIGAGAADSFGEGLGVLFFANAESAPKSDPNEGIILYPAAGTLTLRTGAEVSLDLGGKRASNLASATGTADAATFGQLKISASPYRTINQTAGRATAAAAAGTKYFLVPNNADVSAPAPQTTTGANFPFLFVISSADLAGIGTTKMRVSAVCTTGSKPEATITTGLYPVTAGATQGLGTVVEGSTVAMEKPAANSNTTGSSADFAVPANGVYALGYTVSGTPAVAFGLQAKAEYHHV